jgi:hypothetical protein
MSAQISVYDKTILLLFLYTSECSQFLIEVERLPKAEKDLYFWYLNFIDFMLMSSLFRA